MRKIYSFLLLLLMTVMGTSAWASEVVARGTGWELSDQGTLFITSKDVMAVNYSSASAAPWHAYRNQVKMIICSRDFKQFAIGSYTFCDMPKLVYMTVPGNRGYTFTVGERAFENSYNLPYIVTHASCTLVGEYAFKNCARLESFGFEQCATIGGHAFDGCTKLIAYNMEGCSTIGDAAFKDCTNLGTVKAENCKTIGSRAFENCQLAYVKLGSAIQRIDDNAFDYGIKNEGMLEITRNTPPTLGNNVFRQVYCSSVLLLYPEGTSAAWNVAPWNDFKLPDYNIMPKICLYGVIDSNTITLYYSDINHDGRGGVEEWNSSTFKLTATKIIIDPSVANAPFTTLKEMFYSFTKVTAIEGFEYINTKNVTSMESMFSNCNALETIDLSRLNTSNVTNMSMMFSFCRKLQSLDLTRIDMSKVTDVSGMFYGSSVLTTIYCNDDWSTNSKISNSDMLFTNCRNLVGGNGTAWDASYVDKSYARPDGDNDQPGYFTRTIVIPDMPDTEDIEDVRSTDVQSTKIIRDGMLLIEKNGKTYNAQGVEVK